MATLFSSDFFTRLALGLLVNFEISIVALVLGLVSGRALALIYTTLSLPPLRWLISGFISILRATPVFIAMFFLAGLLRPHYASIGQYIDDPKKFFVVIACLPYIASYSFDQVGEAVSQLKNGTARAALLLIPNMARFWFGDRCQRRHERRPFRGRAAGRVPFALCLVRRHCSDLLPPHADRGRVITLATQGDFTSGSLGWRRSPRLAVSKRHNKRAHLNLCSPISLRKIIAKTRLKTQV
jgi:hypothetical protein